MERKTLTLKKPPDPAKIAQSLEIGFRFIDRKGRYILQKNVVYERPIIDCSAHYVTQKETTWIDIPLVPELYGEAV